MPVEGSSLANTSFSLQAMQLNNFSTQSPKCIHRGSICSSIIDLLNNSIISKIRRWRIELCGGENPECGEGGDRDRAHLNSSANNLNSLFPIRLQYYWIYTYFLIRYRPFQRFNNIENPSMTHWVMWWKTWMRRRPYLLILGYRIGNSNLLLVEGLTKQRKTFRGLCQALKTLAFSNSQYFTTK